MTKPTAEQVGAWMAKSTAAQGVPVKVTDQTAVEAVVTLLREGRTPGRVRDARSG